MDRYALLLPIALLAAMFGWLYARPSPDGAKVYYRVTVGLSHRGVPIDFDVVVGCGVKIGDDRYSGRSYDVQAWWPYVYAKAIDGGHAVALRTDAEANPCLGNTSTRGRGPGLNEPAIPKDWLPLIVWYDRAEDLSHGLGYVTRDAYERPNSELEFHGARIDTATRADYEQFVKTAPPNLIPSYLAGSSTVLGSPIIGLNVSVSPEIRAQPWRAWPFVDKAICRGVQRWAMTPAQKASIAALWPASHPHFWSVDPSQQVALLHTLFPTPPPFDTLFRYTSATPSQPSPDVFPMFSDASLDKITPAAKVEQLYTFRIHIENGSSLRGLMSCDADASTSLLQNLAGVSKVEAETAWPYRCYFDGNEVKTSTRSCNGTSGGSWVVFQDDQYAIFNKSLIFVTL